MFSCASPPPDLAPHVRLLWAVRAPRSAVRAVETIVPDGCCELVVHAGTPYLADGAQQPQALLHGQLQRAMQLVPGGEADLVAVRFEPAGVATLFGIDAAALKSAAVDLLDLFGAAGRELTERVQMARDTAARWQLLCDFLRRQRSERRGPQAWLAQEAAQRMGAAAPRSAALARDLGSSRRSLERAFAASVGLSPAQYLRIRRVSRAAAILQQGPVALADLAADCGYADQPHFTREFSALVGVTPARFARAAATGPQSIVPE